MTINLTHTARLVADIDACLAFYRVYASLGIVRDHNTHDNRAYWLTEPGKETASIRNPSHEAITAITRPGW